MTSADSKLHQSARRLDAWMRTSAWPLWWSQGRHPNGAFFEALDFDGKAIASDESRVRVQARQLFCFALARRLGWQTDSFHDDIVESAERFLATCFRPDGVAGRRVDIVRGELIDETPDLYDNAFCLLALAQFRGGTDSGSLDKQITHFLHSIDEHLAYEDNSGFREFIPPPSARRQNPHMHFFESLLLLYDVTGNDEIRQRAESLYGFIRATFFDGEQCVVSEEVDTRNPVAVDTYEPGHSMEWVWLLGYRARLFDVELDEFALSLYRHYRATANQPGKTPMCLTTSNEPVDASCRLWSQTESLKAHLCMVELGPPDMADVALERASECADSIYSMWLADACSGGWLDHFDADGQCTATNMPSSTGYHLFLAIAELARVAGR